MAVISLATTQAASVESLLESLAPNAQPVVPSAWPLAIGYWLIAAVLIALLLGIFVWLKKTQSLRATKREISRISNLNNEYEKLVASNQLIRWLCITQEPNAKRVASSDFTSLISQFTSKPIPHWVNAHYQKNGHITVDKNELTQLSFAIIKGQRL